MKLSTQAYCFYFIAFCLVTLQVFAYLSVFPPLDFTKIMNNQFWGGEIVLFTLNTLYSNLLSILEITCSFFIFLYLHDYNILKKRQQIGEKAYLSLEGIAQINQKFQLETIIIHEDTDCGSPNVYKHRSSTYELKDFEDELQLFDHYQKNFDVNLEGIPRKSETYLHVCTLPHLPSVTHKKKRLQVGLFATQKIPQWSLFYWNGDIDIIHNSERHLLSPTVKMNRRTLASFGEVSFFQGGDAQQRSGCGVLANFFWCNTQSTAMSLSPYWILPAHFLGEPNCIYVTTKKEDKLCSALLTFKDIEADEQILMFTGSDKEVQVLDRWIQVYKAIPILVGASLLFTVLKGIVLIIIFKTHLY